MEKVIPVHVGIIMDGNGRWAQKRSLVRTQGHLEGLKTAKRIVKAASDIGIKYLTLYAFSTENWKRSSEEVSFIMNLIKQYLRSEFDFSKSNKIRVRYTGDFEGLPSDIQKEITYSITETAELEGMQVILAINYGGRDEIVRACRRLLNKNYPDSRPNEHLITDNICENDISACMDNPDIPDPDLIIRSAGDQRISNFLLWESAYSEIYISGKLWPDWDREDLEEVIAEYQKRERRYGGVNGGIK